MRASSLYLILSMLCAAYIAYGLPVVAEALAKRYIPGRTALLIIDPNTEATYLRREDEGTDKISRSLREKRAIPKRPGFIITDPTSDTKELKKGEAEADKQSV